MNTASNTVVLRAPYLVFIGNQQNAAYLKTGFGIVHWCRNRVAGQLRLSEDALDLGVPDMDLETAAKSGVKSLLIGVAPVGGEISAEWWQLFVHAAQLGLDIVNGLHNRLADHPGLVAAAKSSGARLLDLRVPPQGIPVGTGRNRPGKRVLMVGTDCAVGKKYTALSLDLALKAEGVKSTFRATGQTGIMIAGEGIAIDAVVADFVAGAAELISPDNEPDHWDVIEGQGSLFHPGYAGVSLGLLHGSQPDAIVVCHDPMRSAVIGAPDYTPPDIANCIELNLAAGRLTNPRIRCVGVSINTSALSSVDREVYLTGLSDKLLLPCIDPMIDSWAPIISLLLDDKLAESVLC